MNKNNKNINEIFNDNFNIKKADPDCFDHSYLITAVLHNHKNMIFLDKYFNYQSISLLIYALARQQQLDVFLDNVNIKDQLSNALLKYITHSNGIPVSFRPRQELHVPIVPYSYKIRKKVRIFNVIEDECVTSTFLMKSFFYSIIKNKTLPYPILIELEKYAIRMQESNLILLKAQYPDLKNYEHINPWNDHLKSLRRHKNYSVAKYILKNIAK